jgi:hypothetical protein
MIKGQPYQDPPAVFQAGEIVIFLGLDDKDPDVGKRYRVKNSNHAHTTVEGRRYAVVNWLLKRPDESWDAYYNRSFVDTEKTLRPNPNLPHP